MELLLLVIAVTLAISAFCSLLEATLYSTRVAELEAAKAEGRNRQSAVRFLELKRDIASPTSAILILNTIANTAGATLAGWLASQAYGAHFVPMFSGALTLAILFLSEILPKTFGATNWKVLWPWLALPLDVLVRLLRPAVWVTRRFSMLFTKDTGAPAVTEDEIRASIKLGARSGELTAIELQMLDAVFQFDETTVQQIMVPRDEVVYCDLSEPPQKFVETLKSSPFTRYPVCRGGLDELVGSIHARDLIGVELKNDLSLESLVREVLKIPETLPINKLLRQMQTHRKHLAVVITEHGTVSGIVTLTEVLEQIVGSLEDELETDVTTRPIMEEAPDSYRVRGNVALARLNRELGLDLYEPSVVTLSGLVMSRIGRLPRAKDVVELEGATAEVLKVRSNRATDVRLKLLRAPARPAHGVEPAPDANGEGAS